jgi:cation diffusion facilitator CzcD-associated flavoprotein CzcO
MRAYFEFVDQKLDLSCDISFDARVCSAHFNEHRKTWTVGASSANAGEITLPAHYLKICIGFGTIPYIPSLAGLETFAGACHHAGHWPQGGLDFAGQRVGIIGTGASGIQVAQEAAHEGRQLTIFQRTPNLCLPMRQHQLDASANQRLHETYADGFAMREQSFQAQI